MTKASAINKVRKLLAVVSSSKGHEAAAAADRAKSLMKKFDLHADDITPPEIIETVVDDKNDYWREQLAFATAKARGCKPILRTNGEIAIRGEHIAHDSATALYKYLMTDAETACANKLDGVLRRARLSDKPHLTQLVTDVWSERFYIGFVEEITRRIAPTAAAPTGNTTQESDAPQLPKQAATAEDVIVERGLALVDALEEFIPTKQAASATEQIFKIAYEQGESAASMSDCGVWPPPSPSKKIDYSIKCLPPWSGPERVELLETYDPMSIGHEVNMPEEIPARYSLLEID